MSRLDIVDWPQVGDEVLYRGGATGQWTPATVLSIASHDGDLNLDTGKGPDLAAPGQWLRYEDAAALRRGGDA